MFLCDCISTHITNKHINTTAKNMRFSLSKSTFLTSLPFQMKGKLVFITSSFFLLYSSMTFCKCLFWYLSEYSCSFLDFVHFLSVLMDTRFQPSLIIIIIFHHQAYWRFIIIVIFFKSNYPIIFMNNLSRMNESWSKIVLTFCLVSS